ncbi:MAG: hypothetical protein ACK476_06655 [Fluviicola sp.]|jgi:hypothetical protein
MRTFLFCFFFPFLTICQTNDPQKHRFTIGASFQLARYKFYETNYSGKDQKYYTTKENDLGYYFDVRLNYQNKFFITSFENGINLAPVPAYGAYQIQLKQAFNINFKDRQLKNFIGPFVSYGCLIGFHEESKTLLNLGFLYSSKNIQFELGKIFRQQYDNYSVQFINGYFISIGYRIPLKKEPKN